jgi:hypothetical protein
MQKKPSANDEPEPRVPAVRRPYHSPRLLRFGTLDTITSTVGKSGAMDGGSGMGANKTS